jgi:hypothetical protein
MWAAAALGRRSGAPLMLRLAMNCHPSAAFPSSVLGMLPVRVFDARLSAAVGDLHHGVVATQPWRSIMQRRTLLSEITLEHGPTDAIAQLIALAEEKIAQRGVSLSFAAFDELVRVNEANRETWLPLIPTFDPRIAKLGSNNAFCILGRNVKGEVVVTQAARYWDLGASNLHEHFSSHRIYYDNPDREKGPGERCEITIEEAKAITGRVVFLGAVWYRPDYRGLETPRFLNRIARTYAHSLWATVYSTATVAEAVMKTRLRQMAGYTKFGWSVDLHNNPMLGSGKYALCWMDNVEMLSDLLAFNAADHSQVDRRIEGRGTQ